MKNCNWKCGRKTKNHSGICEPCWQAAELTRTITKEGYNVWLERKRAKTKPQSTARNVHLKKARGENKAKRLIDLPATALSQPIEG